MRRSIGFLCLIILLFSLTLIINANKILSTSSSELKYTWVSPIAPDKGCWPDCVEGQWCWPKSCDHHGEWPMTIVPLVASYNQLWMIGQRSTWFSSDGIRWNKRSSNAGWGERYSMARVYFDNRVWMMGGMQKSWDNFKNDVWYSADGTNWKLATARAEWSPRRWHTVLVFDGKMWVLGGAESSGRADQTPRHFLSDVWSSTDGIHWSRITSTAPWTGELNSVVFNDKMWVIGSGGAWWSRDGKNWAQVTANAKWLDRGGNRGAGCVVFDGRIWVFGGINAKGMMNDVWFSSDGASWQQATVHAPWKPRGTANSVVFDNKLWIYGGKTGRDEWFAGDVWQMARTQ